jgi:hypothetical protein
VALFIQCGTHAGAMGRRHANDAIDWRWRRGGAAAMRMQSNATAATEVAAKALGQAWARRGAPSVSASGMRA